MLLIVSFYGSAALGPFEVLGWLVLLPCLC